LSSEFAWALDHDNLDKNRPVQIEDAYSIPKGEIALEGGARFNDRWQGKTRFVFQPQVLYGAYYNTQLESEGIFSPSRPRSKGPRSPGIYVLVSYTTSTPRRSLCLRWP